MGLRLGVRQAYDRIWVEKGLIDIVLNRALTIQGSNDTINIVSALSIGSISNDLTKCRVT